jgi:hypothetical protein
VRGELDFAGRVVYGFRRWWWVDNRECNVQYFSFSKSDIDPCAVLHRLTERMTQEALETHPAVRSSPFTRVISWLSPYFLLPLGTKRDLDPAQVIITVLFFILEIGSSFEYQPF